MNKAKLKITTKYDYDKERFNTKVKVIGDEFEIFLSAVEYVTRYCILNKNQTKKEFLNSMEKTYKIVKEALDKEAIENGESIGE